MAGNSFSREEHLKKNSSIRLVFEKGAFYRGKAVYIYILNRRPSDKNVNRAAFICRKNLYQKKKVLRNRFRRVLKEAYRNARRSLAPGHDLVILAVNITKDTKSTLIENEICGIFKKCSKI